MFEYLIYIVTLSFQLVGGIALLFSYWMDIKKEVSDEFYGKVKFQINKLEDITAEDEMELVKIIHPIFMGRFSFILLVIGYLLSPLGSLGNMNKICAICHIYFITSIICIIILISTYLYAKKCSKTKKYRMMILGRHVKKT